MTAAKLMLTDWLKERLDNCIRIGAACHYDDKQGWSEDAEYFRAAITLQAEVERKDAEIARLRASLKDAQIFLHSCRCPIVWIDEVLAATAEKGD